MSAAAGGQAVPHPDIVAALGRLGVVRAGEPVRYRALTGGVSSDIWLVERPDGPVCVKRALAKLRVAADWRAPVERNATEAAWLEAAGRIVPGAAPRIVAQEPASGVLVMEYLPPADHPVWKAELAAGRADPAFAAAVGDRLGRIHAATAGDPAVAARFATDAIFHAIRLEPYLLATAERHPDRAEVLRALAARTAATRLALVHGDVSPKNILVGPHGPVLIDAECAWYGDPAFDLAFCLNHTLLKCLWVPAAAEGFLACFEALAAAHLRRVAWEDPAAFEARVATLLPGLLLARVDGKSPVEYLAAETDRATVRAAARDLLARPVARLDGVAARWRQALAM